MVEETNVPDLGGYAVDIAHKSIVYKATLIFHQLFAVQYMLGAVLCFEKEE